MRVCWLVGQDRLTWVPRNPSIHVMRLRPILLGPQGSVSPGSHLLLQGLANRQAPEALLFRGMPTGPKAFVGAVGVSVLQPCVRLQR